MELMFDKHFIITFLTILFHGIGLYVLLGLFITESRPDWRVIGGMVLFTVVLFIVVSCLSSLGK